jgi:hypothetical protein
MGIPIAKTFTTSFWGSACKIVQCDQCKKEYVYQVKRRGQGEGTSVLFLDENGALNRATQRANRDLQKALDSAIEIVPCPACGWIQPEMQILARRQYLSRMKIAGFVVLLTLFFPCLMLLVTLTDPADEPVPPRLVIEIIVLGLVQILTAVALLWGRSLACKHYDPNSGDVEIRLQKGRELAILVDDLEKEKKERQG